MPKSRAVLQMSQHHGYYVSTVSTVKISVLNLKNTNMNC